MRESQAKESQTELREIKATLRSIHADPQPAPRTNPSRTITSLNAARSTKAAAKASTKAPAKRTHLEVHPAWQPVEPPAPQPDSPDPAPQSASQSETQSETASRQPAKSIALPPIQPRFAPTPIEPNESAWDGQVDWQPHLSHRADPLADTVARLQEKSTQYLQQLAQSVWDSPAQQIEIAMQQLEAQAQHVNELATTQEAALLELKAIAKQVERDWKTLELNSATQHGYAETDLQIPALCEYKPIAVPQVEKNDRGVLVVSGRAIDWFKAEREAELTAQALRHRTTQPHRSKRSWAKAFSQWLFGTSSKSRLGKSRLGKIAGNPHVNSASSRTKRHRSPSFTLREGATLMIGAMVVRVLLNLLVTAHPVFQFPAFVLMVAPGAIAIWRSTVTPRSMLAWSGRLMAVMLGFWLTGRLFL
jgi:hypothetical protein